MNSLPVFSSRFRIAGILTLLFPVLCCTNNTLKNGKRVEVAGIVRITGSTPFTEVIITDSENNDWYIEARDAKKLHPFQHTEIRVRGTVRLTEILLANNKSLGIRRSLSKVEVLDAIKAEKK
ncbi:MAG: hypothetical protein LBG79_05655 [Spirochaetaceae bacterium]|nr:hypothetical protein [Spirochaetaceae bacterium]